MNNLENTLTIEIYWRELSPNDHAIYIAEKVIADGLDHCGLSTVLSAAISSVDKKREIEAMIKHNFEWESRDEPVNARTTWKISRGWNNE